ncbi:NEQ386 [Nanoarchaeum equitans Kin4-M]|uniref:NEQ386 n=1 Tax=Nanoarchaeum equitans (strain Kin4-M) TaxID=228908 RepID=Q74MD7_NANEQ|nr:NEQ386 [Nanoarchaeum equitans Kin4-M]
MKAAVACYESNGVYKLFPTEFGHAPIFVIVDLDTKQIVEKRENPYKGEESKDKFKKLAEYLKDVDYFVGKQFGTSVLKLRPMFNKIPVVVNAETLEEAIEKLSNSKDKLNLDSYVILL